MSVSAGELDRDSLELPNGDEGRLYFDPSTTVDDDPLTSDFVAPSVTTVLNYRHDPDKDEAINGWREFYDGSCSRQLPHWSDQQRYKQYRGTLAHFAVLSQLGGLERGEEEEEAEEGLRYWFRHAPYADNEDVPATILDAMETYWVCIRKGDNPQAALKQAEGGHGVELAEWVSTLDNTYDGKRAWEQAMREVNTVCELFQSKVVDAKGLVPDDIITVEDYAVVEEPVAYAGQADLVYETDGDTYLTDLKTSGKIREGYKLQLGAYAHALPYDFDYVETVSIDPEDKEVAIETNDDWERTIDSLTNEFLGLCLRTHHEQFSTL